MARLAMELAIFFFSFPHPACVHHQEYHGCQCDKCKTRWVQGRGAVSVQGSYFVCGADTAVGFLRHVHVGYVHPGLEGSLQSTCIKEEMKQIHDIDYMKYKNLKGNSGKLLHKN